MLNPFGLALVLITIVLAVIAYCYSTGNTYDKFKKNGIRTEAKIINMEKIGASGTGNTKLRMEITFNTDTEVVTTVAKAYISPQNMVKIMRKHSIYIYYMPANPKDIFLMPGEMA